MISFVTVSSGVQVSQPFLIGHYSRDEPSQKAPNESNEMLIVAMIRALSGLKSLCRFLIKIAAARPDKLCDLNTFCFLLQCLTFEKHYLYWLNYWCRSKPG